MAAAAAEATTMAAEAAMAEAAMECGPVLPPAVPTAPMPSPVPVRPPKERPDADDAAIWVRAVIRIPVPIGVVIGRGRRRDSGCRVLDDVALARHALGIGDVVLRLCSSGDGARVARADCGAGQQPGARADRCSRTGIAARRTQQRAGRGTHGRTRGGAAD